MLGDGQSPPEHVSRGVRTSASLVQQQQQQTRNENSSSDIVTSLSSESQYVDTQQTSESSVDGRGVYKMRAVGRTIPGKSPTRIEFELVRKRPAARQAAARRQLNFHRLRREPMRRRVEEGPLGGEVPPSQMLLDLNAMEAMEASQPEPKSPSWREKWRNAFKRNRTRRVIVKGPETTTTLATMEEGKSAGADEEGKGVESVDLDNMEIYYFDRGCVDYFRTSDCPPQLISDVLAYQTAYHATKFWSEVFGFLNVGVTFFICFLLQAYRFILYSLFRALLVGFLQITADYLIKPLFAVLFNGFIQPPLTFTQNILISSSNTLLPISQTIGHFLQPLVQLLRSFRLIEVKNIQRAGEKRSPQPDPPEPAPV